MLVKNTNNGEWGTPTRAEMIVAKTLPHRQCGISEDDSGFGMD